MIDSCFNCATLLIDSDDNGNGGNGGCGGGRKITQLFTLSTNLILENPLDEEEQEVECHQIVSVTKAINIIFEAAFKLAKAKPSKHTAEEVLCGNCAQVLSELYNYYTKFMTLSAASSRFVRSLKKSSLWNFNDDAKKEKGSLKSVTDKKLLHRHDVKYQSATKIENQNLNLYDTGNMDYEDNLEYEDFNEPEPEPETGSEIFIKQEPVKFDVVEEASILSPNQDIGNRSLRIRIQKLSKKSLRTTKIKNNKKHQSEMKKRYSTSSQKTQPSKKNSTKFHNSTTKKDRKVKDCRQLPYICSNCPNKGFSTELLLEKHVLFHHGKSYDENDGNGEGRKPKDSYALCEHCNKYFTSKRRLKKHLSLEHPDTIPAMYSCDVCSKTYDRLPSLRAHKATTHNKINSDKNYCNLCSKYFTSSSHLRIHLSMIHDKVDPKTGQPLAPTPCPICGKSIMHAFNMARHMKQSHPSPTDPNPRPFQCEQCGASFKTKDTLNIHLKEDYHGHKDKKYKCLSCNHSYATQERLDRHLKFHDVDGTGMDEDEVARHKCSECGKFFHRHSNLKKHILSLHTVPELRPSYGCGDCGAVFKLKDYLVQHIKHKCRGGGSKSLGLGNFRLVESSGNENFESTSEQIQPALQLYISYETPQTNHQT